MKFVKVKNISDSKQAFAGIKCFEPKEERKVAEDVAEYLLRSPFIEKVEGKKPKRKEESFKAVEEKDGVSL